MRNRQEHSCDRTQALSIPSAGAFFYLILDFANYLVYNITTISEVTMSKMTIKAMMELQDHFIKADIIKDPKDYTAEELKYLNPNVPPDFIDDHVAVRDGKKKESDWQRIPLKIEDL
jgi:hypothetical protein